MTDKNILVKEFIENRPNLSGNKIYEQIKGKEFSIRKTDFYALLRELRKLPEPTFEKKEKSVPIKYKIEPIISKPKKEGKYGLVEVIDVKNNSYWIKYDNEKSYERQLEKIKQKYPKIKRIKFHGFRDYREFIDQEFKELLNEVGISTET